MNEFDLIINYDKLEILFIMESPHTDELQAGIPCMGLTGKRMAQHLIDDDRVPLGLLLKNADSRVVRYGIMNTFSFPLGIKDDLSSSPKRVAALKDIPWITGKTSRRSHYAKHLELIRSVEHVEQLAGFKTRLIDYVSKSPNLKNIVICGYIAQSMYLYSFNQKIPAYNVPISLNTTSKRNLKLLFANYPSEKNKVWDFDRMKLDN